MIPEHIQFIVGMQYHIESSDSVKMVSLSLSYRLHIDTSDILLASQPRLCISGPVSEWCGPLLHFILHE